MGGVRGQHLPGGPSPSLGKPSPSLTLSAVSPSVPPCPALPRVLPRALPRALPCALPCPQER
jgi:hypothetical protein